MNPGPRYYERMAAAARKEEQERQRSGVMAAVRQAHREQAKAAKPERLISASPVFGGPPRGLSEAESQHRRMVEMHRRIAELQDKVAAYAAGRPPENIVHVTSEQFEMLRAMLETPREPTPTMRKTMQAEFARQHNVKVSSKGIEAVQPSAVAKAPAAKPSFQIYCQGDYLDD